MDNEIADAGVMDEEGNDELVAAEVLNHDNLDSDTILHKTQQYIDIMQKLDDALKKESDMMSSHTNIPEGDPDYQLIVDLTALSVDIENEIIIAQDFIKDNYRLKLPELESLVHHPIDYARMVNFFGNETNLTLVDLEDLLPLPEENLKKIIDACGRVLDLVLAKKKVLSFIESRMGTIAPNLSVIVGTEVAAKLMGAAGGLSALAKMPACNVQTLGSKRKHLAGFSASTSQIHLGYIEQTEVFLSTPPPLRTRALRLIASKATLVARVDANGSDPTGVFGRTTLELIIKKIGQWQGSPPPKQPMPLHHVPDSDPNMKRRGGRRVQKMIERNLSLRTSSGHSKVLSEESPTLGVEEKQIGLEIAQVSSPEEPSVSARNVASLSFALQTAMNMSSSFSNVSTGLSMAETLVQAPLKACTASPAVNSSEKSKLEVSKYGDVLSSKVRTPQPSSHLATQEIRLSPIKPDIRETSLSAKFDLLDQEGSSSSSIRNVQILSCASNNPHPISPSNNSKSNANDIGVDKNSPSQLEGRKKFFSFLGDQAKMKNGVSKSKGKTNEQNIQGKTVLAASNSVMKYCTVAINESKDEIEALGSPNGEEKAFLESLGWNPNIVEDALTAEEIESFLEKVSQNLLF